MNSSQSLHNKILAQAGIALGKDPQQSDEHFKALPQSSLSAASMLALSDASKIKRKIFVPT